MTKDQVRDILDRVLTWPEHRQADVAGIVQDIEAQDRNPCHLNDEQRAEVRRRRADLEAKTLTLAEWDERLRRFGA